MKRILVLIRSHSLATVPKPPSSLDPGVWLEHLSVPLLSTPAEARVFIQELVADLLSERRLADEVVGTDGVSSLIAAAVSEGAGLSGPSVQSVIRSRNALRFRHALSKHLPRASVSASPLTSSFLQQSKHLQYPLFVKPAFSECSVFSFRVNTPNELRAAYRKWSSHVSSVPHPLSLLVQTLSSKKLEGVTLNPLVVEPYIEAPAHVTIDGRVHGSDVTFSAVTRLVFVPETVSVETRIFPHRFPTPRLKKEVFSVVREAVRILGLTDTPFHAEVKYDPRSSRVWLMSLHSYGSRSFLFPSSRVVSEGPHQHALSFILRRREDGRVHRVPSKKELQLLYRKYPTAAYQGFVEPKMLLSHIPQDAHTYRYGQITVVGKTPQEVESTLRAVKQELLPRFSFSQL